MTKNTKLDENLEGAEKFIAWKYRIMLILQENDLHKFVKEEVKEPKEYEAESKHNKDVMITKGSYMTPSRITWLIKYYQEKIQKKCLMLFPVYLKEET